MATGAIAGAGQVFAACDQRLTRLSGRLGLRLLRQREEASE